MAEEICTNQDQIEWKSWYRLAEKIDDLAVAVGVPAYDKLTEDEDLSFIEPSLPQVEGVMLFETTANAACPLVADRYLQTDFQGAKVAWPGTPMTGAGGHAFYDTYITNGNLFFVHEEDHCWCKMIFKDNCQVKYCNMSHDLLYYGKRVCIKCWTKHCQENINLKEIFKYRFP